MPRSVRFHRTGGPEVLACEDVPARAPGPHELRVRVRAAGVNFIDVYHRTGLYPSALPFAAGYEGAGVVEEVGGAVRGFREGDRVAWPFAPGSYADEIVLPESAAVAIPDPVGEETAAAAMLQGMTAHYLTHGVRATRPGDTALVHAAAGGTGLLLVQMLKAAGAYVIGTCSTDEKERVAQAAGCDRIVRYTEADVPEAVKRITAGRGVDVVYDSVGQATFEGSLASLRPRGLLCSFGQSSGPVPPFELRRLNAMGSLFVTRPTLAHYMATREELEMRANDVLDAVADARLDVRIGARFPLERADEAHRALEGRASTGKLLLIPT
ncbi:MAG: quinone oxidoreductase [Myxococcota bacterium]|nr:quinone oxidoreductase [Myxococcales bacterium]